MICGCLAITLRHDNEGNIEIIRKSQLSAREKARTNSLRAPPQETSDGKTEPDRVAAYCQKDHVDLSSAYQTENYLLALGGIAFKQ